MDIAPKAAREAEKTSSGKVKAKDLFYCPVCAIPVNDPLTCGDCSAVICRRCGTPLESSDELAMG